MDGWKIGAPESPFLSEDEAALVMSSRPATNADSDYAMAILAGLQNQAHVYQGTVDPVTVALRRKRNKAARKSRRTNRKQARR